MNRYLFLFGLIFIPLFSRASGIISMDIPISNITLNNGSSMYFPLGATIESTKGSSSISISSTTPAFSIFNFCFYNGSVSYSGRNFRLDLVKNGSIMRTIYAATGLAPFQKTCSGSGFEVLSNDKLLLKITNNSGSAMSMLPATIFIELSNSNNSGLATSSVFAIIDESMASTTTFIATTLKALNLGIMLVLVVLFVFLGTYIFNHFSDKKDSWLS